MSKKYVEVTFIDSYDDAFGGNHEFQNVEVFSKEYFEKIKGAMQVISTREVEAIPEEE